MRSVSNITRLASSVGGLQSLTRSHFVFTSSVTSSFRRHFSDKSPLMSDDEFRAAMSEITEMIIDYKREMRMVPPRMPVGNMGSSEDNKMHLDFSDDRQCSSSSSSLSSESLSKPKHSQLLSDVKEQVIPRMTHWDSLNFFAWFNTINDYSAVIGATLSSALGTVPFTYRSNPASTELEIACMDHFADVFGIPSEFTHSAGMGGGGCLQSSASNACLVSMFAAKQRAIAHLFQSLDKKEQSNTTPNQLSDRLVCYISDQTHVSVEKAAVILGIPNIRRVHTDSECGYAIQDGKQLSAMMKEDLSNGMRPFFLCLTLGTTSSGGIDQTGKIMDDLCSEGLIQDGLLWTHLDGAYGLAYGCLADEMTEQQKIDFGFDGIHKVDSITLNGPKALMQTFPLSLYWVRRYSWLNQALKMDPTRQEYLMDRSLNTSSNNIDFKEWQTELGRGFGAMKLLCLARLVGRDGLKIHMKRRLLCADYLENRLCLDEWWAMRVQLCVKPPRRKLGFVCFRFRNLNDDKHLRLLDRVNQSGQVFLIHTVLEGRVCLRVAVGGADTMDVIHSDGNNKGDSFASSFAELDHLLNTLKQNLIEMGLDIIPDSKVSKSECV